jgi:tetratricopeptide (TPR) repeat protein
MHSCRIVPRLSLALSALIVLAVALAADTGGLAGTARADDKVIAAPPADVNALSMEVAVLRTLFLLKAAPHHLEKIRTQFKDGVMKPRKREAADASPEYKKTLTDLRAALIAGDEDRVNELSDQLEELAKDDEPDVDDAVEISEEARKLAPKLLTAFDANLVVGYLASYGKDFPVPYRMMVKAMRLDGKGKKPTAEQWKEVRANVANDVAWSVAGLDLKEQAKVRDEALKLLDRAYGLNSDDLAKQQAELKAAIHKITGKAAPLDVIKHVLEQDLAEMISNPRLLPAVEARLQYLKK